MTGDDGADLKQQIANLEAQLRAERIETQHRIRNLLAMTRSLTKRTAIGSADRETAFALLDSRFAAFARAQSMMLRHSDRHVELGALIADETLAHSGRLDGLNLPESRVRIESRTAALFALACHELLTITNVDDPITFGWEVEPDGQLISNWHSTPSHDAAATDLGLLREILDRALPYEVKGQASMEMSDTDLNCRIVVPAANFKNAD